GPPQTFSCTLTTTNDVIFSAPVGGINNQASTNTTSGVLFGITKGAGSALPSALINYPAVVTPGPGFSGGPGHAVPPGVAAGAATVLGGHTVNWTPSGMGGYFVY